MFSGIRYRLWPAVAMFCTLAGSAVGAVDAPGPRQVPQNLFGNASFEEGRDQWQLDLGGKTVGRFTVDDQERGAGQRSALLSLGQVDDWGVQFGQRMDALATGKTVTFAVLGKSTKAPTTVRLEIERRGKPWDRAAASSPVALSQDAWQELHVTFRVEKAFPEGWFAYVSCQQPNAEFRLDMFRLYEGEYVPYEQAAKEERAALEVALFDTGVPAAAPLSSQALAQRSGWTRVPEDDTEHLVKGDAVVQNDRLALVLRRGGLGAELYARGPRGLTPRAVLTPAGAGPDVKLTAVNIVENNAGEVVLEAAFQASDGRPAGLRLGVAMGQVFVRTEPRTGTTGLHVGAACRFVVLPDFFADDIVIDAAEIPVAAADLPSENFLLQLVPSREAIVMTVASNRGQDARIELSGEGHQRLIQGSQMEYGPQGKIWVAVIEGAGIWHHRDLEPAATGNVIPLDWTAPFPAQWRVDWGLAGKLTSSWEMVSELKSGEFLKPGWFGNAETLPRDRKRWTTVLGSFTYPCWVDQAGRGFLQPLAKPERCQGATLVYPINRARETPLADFTVVDVVRATLGVGPCEYILDVEGQGATRKGRATCATRDTLKAIYAAKQQKPKRAEIEKVLDEVVIFVKHIRGRIDQYVDFGHETLAYLDQQKQTHPELAEFLAEMDRSTRAIDAAFQRRSASIKTPQYVVDLTEKFRATLLDKEGDEALRECTVITHAIVEVGGNQDELVGECRNAVKVLRQRAGLAMAVHPPAAEIAKELRSRTQKVLRNATSYEAPRH
ncbi:MAG: carbohydrate binding domain-containing protein [Planctomycetota bacterium]|nr:carbohydrate binding domain-containing protein [Planctomycetota bacterium]